MDSVLAIQDILNNKRFLIIASIGAGLSVLLGAFAAHGLKSHLSERMLNAFQTGVDYQFVHSLALMLLTICAMLIEGRVALKRLDWARKLMVVGVLLFSGSLYLLAVTGLKIVAFVTPIGGVLLLCAWGVATSAFMAATVHSKLKH